VSNRAADLLLGKLLRVVDWDDLTDAELRIIEQRVRRAARRQLLILRKIRRLDRRAWDYRRYELLDQEGHVVAAGTLAEIIEHLTR
jgi:hypothetical protein